jgi:hypothetical protein
VITLEAARPLVDVFRGVLREQYGEKAMAWPIDAVGCDDPETDVMAVEFVVKTEIGTASFPITISGQDAVSPEEWFRVTRCEMRGWFREWRKTQRR